MKTPPRRTKTDLRREAPGRAAPRGPHPAETSPEEAAMLLGDAAHELSVVTEAAPEKTAEGTPAPAGL